MAITANTYNIESLPVSCHKWHVSLQSADVNAQAEEIKAAETGYNHYLTRLTVRTDAAMDLSIGYGSTGTLTGTYIGPVPLDAASGIIVWKAPDGYGLKISKGTAIVVYSTGAGTIWIEAHGYTAKKQAAS